MKKILTLLIAFGAVAGANAQTSRNFPSDRNESRDVILGSPADRSYEKSSRYNNYTFTPRERDVQIERINREYDYRIRQVERDRWIRGYEKAYKIRRLEDQRRDDIRQVWERFKASRNQYRDNDYRRNNGRW